MDLYANITLSRLNFINKITSDSIHLKYYTCITIYSALLSKIFPDYTGNIYSHTLAKHFLGLDKGILVDLSLDPSLTLRQALIHVRTTILNDLDSFPIRNSQIGIPEDPVYCLNINPAERFSWGICEMNIDLDGNGSIDITLTVNDQFVSQSLAKTLFNKYVDILTGMDRYIDLPVGSIKLLNEDETRHLLEQYQAMQTKRPEANTIISLLLDQAERNAGDIALVCEERQMTYRQLNEISNQLAHFLRSRYQIRPDDAVAIHLERTEEIVIAILGVLKSGAAYVPIDPQYPEVRKKYIQNDCKHKAVVDEILMVQFRLQQDQFSIEDPAVINKPEDLAYIIYTSGSTGEPKAVMIEHRSVADLLYWAKTEYDVRQISTVYASTSICFDLSVFEIFYPLSVGKTVRIVKDVFSLQRYLPADGNILLNTVPAVVGYLLDQGADFGNVRYLNMAGDVIPLNVLDRLEFDRYEVRNLYGPTEDTVYTTRYLIHGKPGRSVPIGTPIFNTELYILDKFMDPVPNGVVGKIYISGAGLSRGYLNKPQLTAQRFLSNPFKPSVKMYDTGDLGRRLDDGNIEFVGRADRQIKIRGHRIEPGEIEYAIQHSSKVIKHVVVDRRHLHGEETLIAYLVSDSLVNTERLQQQLLQLLPAFMVPSRFVELKAIPLSSNGKIDKDELSRIPVEDNAVSAYTAPRNNRERILSSIWCEVLDVDRVGITDNFFSLGGHSLLAGQVLSKISRQLGGRVSYRTFFLYPTIEQLSIQLGGEALAPILPAPVMDHYPLTPLQRNIWLQEQLPGGAAANIVSFVLRLGGMLDEDRLEKAFKLVIAKNEILRTAFKSDGDGVARQYILEVSKVDFALLKEEINPIERFNLEVPPLMRASLKRLSHVEFVLTLSIHHIITDGWSNQLLFSQVLDAYSGLLNNTGFRLPESIIQYKDYAVWFESQLGEDKFQESRAFWVDQLKKELPVLELPTKEPVKNRSFGGKSIRHHFPETLLKDLNDLAYREQTSLFMILMAGVRAILHRYTGQSDIIIGTPVAGRTIIGSEDQLGLFLNILPIRTSVTAGMSFKEMLAHEKDFLLSAYDHQLYPVHELFDGAAVTPARGWGNIFDVMVVLQNHDKVKTFRRGNGPNELQVEDFQPDVKTVQYPIVLSFDLAAGLALTVQYNAAVFEEQLMARLPGHLENFLKEALQNLGEDVGLVNFLSQEERKTVLFDLNNTGLDYNKDIPVIRLFEEQVKSSPDNIAIWIGDMKMTYEELNSKANQLGRYLHKQYNIQPNDLIGVKMEPDHRMIVAILSVLKSGGAYVPIDPYMPKERVAYIQNDINSKVVIDDTGFDSFLLQSDSTETDNPIQSAHSEDLAYVIYTSGTTGNPKGVMIQNGNLVSRIDFYKQFYGLTPDDASLFYRSYSFDGTIEEYLIPLFSGGTVVIMEKKDKDRMFSQLSRVIKKYGVTKVNLPPSLITQLLSNIPDSGFTGFQNLKHIVCGGEVLKTDLLKHVNRNIRIYNTYGPTECTIDATNWVVDVDRISRKSIIGRPIQYTQIYILDGLLQPVPVGISGNIYISGAGVGRGYLNNPELTTLKFISNPFRKGGKMYDTGDVGRWLEDGNIEFGGRRDQQVKIRGHRIELSEIEFNILKYSEDILETIVEVLQENNDKILVAFMVCRNPVDKTRLRSFLKDYLPSYMMPAKFVELGCLPVNSMGKIDRRRIRSIPIGSILEKDIVAPKTDTEIALYSIWRNVLDVDQISMMDDFSELGGHSLKAIILVSKIEQKFGTRLKLNDIFENTIRGIAEKIDTGGQNITAGPAPWPSIPVDDQGVFELSPYQLRLWMLHSILKRQGYIISGEVKIEISLDPVRLARTLGFLVEKHKILRTIFIVESGLPVQKILPFTQVITLFSVEDAIIDQEIDLGSFPLFRIKANPVANGFVLRLNIHHIICDGWSLEILLREFKTLYEMDVMPVIDGYEFQYIDYSEWVNANLKSNRYAGDLTYWKQILGGAPDTRLPSSLVDQARDESLQTNRGLSFFLDEGTTSKIQCLVARTRTTFMSFFIACIEIWTSRITNLEDVTIGLVVANRGNLHTVNMVGYFVNFILHRSLIDKGEPFSAFMQRVNKRLLEGLEYQTVPYESVGHTSIPSVFINGTDFNLLQHMAYSSDEVENYGQSKFDTEFYIKRYSNGVLVHCCYEHTLFGRPLVEYWMTGLLSIIDEVVRNPEVLCDGLSIFDTFVHRISQNFTQVPYCQWERLESEATIVERFEKVVFKYADQPAVVENNKTTTYAALDHKANGVAASIREISNGGNNSVVLILEHGLNAIIGILAALKCGKSYVPVDMRMPVERIRNILQEISFDVILVSNSSFYIGPLVIGDGNKKRTLLNIDQTTSLPKSPAMEHFPSDIAYILFTSGSTGKPKGVIQNNINVLHFINVYTNRLKIGVSDRVSLIPSYYFDAAVMDIFGALLNGAALYPYDIQTNGLENLFAWVMANGISILHTVPTIYRQLLGSNFDLPVLGSVRLVVLGGEEVLASDFRLFSKHFSDEAIFINGYGPTESTITMQNILSKRSDVTNFRVSLGYPVEETEVLLIRENGKPARVYEDGEIVYKSRFLALGYHNDELLTNIKFQTRADGSRIYYSGDIGKLLPTGEIEFVGRRDNQIKRNGIRVDLDQIDYCIMCCAEVRNSVTLFKDDSIFSFLQLKEGLNVAKEKILSRLKGQLPASMMPNSIIFVKNFSVTNTGKIDRRALMQLITEYLPENPGMAPNTLTELRLTELWQQILGTPPRSTKETFFESGGNSLALISLRNRIAKEIGVEVSVGELYEHNNIEAQASLIDRLLQSSSSDAVRNMKKTEKRRYAQSHQQRRCFNDIRLNYLGNLIYHYDVRQALAPDEIAACLTQLIGECDIFRTVFYNLEGEVIAEVLDLEQFPENYIKIVSSTKHEINEYLKNIRFDLSQPPLFNFVVNTDSEICTSIHFCISHMIFDGFSSNILEEIIWKYLKGEPVEHVQYAEYAQWQADNYFVDAVKADYWRTSLPKDYYKPSYDPADSKIMAYKIILPSGPDLGLSHLLSRYAQWICRTFNVRNPLIQYSSIGRPAGMARFYRCIGFFSNLMLVGLDGAADMEFSDINKLMSDKLHDNLVNEIAFEDILAIHESDRLFPFYLNLQNKEAMSSSLGVAENYDPQKSHLTTFKVGIMARASSSTIDLNIQYDSRFVDLSLIVSLAESLTI